MKMASKSVIGSSLSRHAASPSRSFDRAGIVASNSGRLTAMMGAV
jgi:hypothetical protein